MSVIALRNRGIVMVRNDATKILAELHAAFEAFKAKNEGRLKTVEDALDASNAALAAYRVGGAGAAHRPGRVPIEGEVADQFHAQLIGRPSAAMTTQSDPDGGYTVRPEVDRIIDAVLRETSPMRRLARVVSLGAGTGHWEKILGHQGAQTAWAGEEEDRTETENPKLRKIEIFTHEIYAIPQLTNHIIEDANFDMTSFVEEDVSGEFALGEGDSFANGNGVKKPRGFLTYDVATTGDDTRELGKLQYVPSGAAGAFVAASTSVSPADCLKNLKASLKPAYRRGATWMMNSATQNVISKFKDADERFIYTESLVAGDPDKLLGYPVEIDESMPDIAANSLSVAYGNWKRAYAIVDKPGLRLIVDRVTRKGWTKLYFSRRVGGGMVDFDALKLLKFAES